MDKKNLQKRLIKVAKEAFEQASTLSTGKRIEVYYEKMADKITISPPLEQNETILYDNNRIVCYVIDGNATLEDEIKTWIDIARDISTINDKEGVSEPTDVEEAIRSLADEIANTRSLLPQQVSSYEIFANLPFNLIEKIESSILEFWWYGDEDEDSGKYLALNQINEAVEEICA
jgi:hypothetical protein